MSRNLVLAATFAALLSAGCFTAPLGPRTISPARLNYNDAISRSWDEQLLLNLVRVRYIQSPLFVDIGGITAAYAMGGNASINGRTVRGGNEELGFGLGMSLSDNPVISYNYLQGGEFAQRILTPLTVATIEPLVRSGWSLDAILSCCVQSLNGIENDMRDRPTFRRIVEKVAELQGAGQLRISRDADGSVYLNIRDQAPRAAFLAELGAPASAARLRLVDGRESAAGELAVEGRSLLASLYVLSHGVEIPPGDENLVAPLRDASGAEVDPSLAVGSMLHVHAGATPPPNAAVAINTRDRWYWIKDTDLQSKNTLALLRMLLFLKAVPQPAQQPIVTIPSR